MAKVFLGVGTNLGDRWANIDRALEGLAAFAPVVRRSPVYETAPMYVTDQPRFLNLALEVTTELPPEPLLDALKALEAAVGRVPGRRFGERVIDLDILFHGDTVLRTDRLEIPHPRLPERAFVLRPLADLAPDLRHPRLGSTIAALLAALPTGDDSMSIVERP